MRSLASTSILSASESDSIGRSLVTLQSRIDEHFGRPGQFGAKLKQRLVFGSYTRGTILPRKMDAHSDVDYMVVFTENSLKPQAYLERLKVFAEKYYPRSEVAQSHPTIVLSLNRINFELVPTIEDWSGLKIPGKGGLFNEWISTSPNDINDSLVRRNTECNSEIKPLIRILKYWNALNGYPFESFGLEKAVIVHRPWLWPQTGDLLWARFRAYVQDMSLEYGAPQWKRDAVDRAKTIVTEVQRLKDAGDEIKAEAALKRLIPSV